MMLDPVDGAHCIPYREEKPLPNKGVLGMT